MNWRFLVWVSSLLILLSARMAGAETPTCAALAGAKRDVAQAVLRSAHPHDCCDGTLLECLSRKPVCPLAVRLANDVCRRADAGQSKADIERELSRRAASVQAPRSPIDVGSNPVAGDPQAKVEIVAYLCARCPYCARLAPELYKSVTEGRLKGKAKLIVRPFPLRTHQHSTVASMATLAAQRQGKYWEMLLHLYQNFQSFTPEKLPDWAASKGMDRARFSQELADPALRNQLAAAKKEGIRNGVEATPTLFINRRKYFAELSLAAIEDFVEEVHAASGATATSP